MPGAFAEAMAEAAGSTYFDVVSEVVGVDDELVVCDLVVVGAGLVALTPLAV